MLSEIVNLRLLMRRCSFVLIRTHPRQFNESCALHQVNYFRSFAPSTNLVNSRMKETETQPCQRGNILMQQIRTKKRFKKKQERAVEEDSDDERDAEDQEIDDDEGHEYFNKHYPEDRNLPGTYKEMAMKVMGTRLDFVCRKTLQMPRSAVDVFMEGKISLNNIKVTKKATKVSEGDFIDLRAGVDNDGQMQFKRVRIVKIIAEGNAYKLYVRVWRAPMPYALVK